MKRTFKYTKILLFILTTVLLVIISASTTLYGDDFLYGTYFKDGFKNFIDLSVEHYKNTNGRAFVHFVLEIVLFFKDRLFFAVIPMMVLGSYIMFFKAFKDKADKISKLGFLTLSTAGLMCISVYTLREGLLWMSGAMNYVFPLVLSFSALFILEKADALPKTPWYFYPLAFLSGATTEQGGAMTLALVVLYILYYSIKDKKRRRTEVYILALIVLAGYISIFLSPATLSRLFRETTENTVPLITRMDSLFNLCFGSKGALLLFILAELAVLFEIFRKNKAASVIGAVLLCISAVCILLSRYVLGGVLMALIFILSAAVMLILDIRPKMAMAMISAGAGMVMLLCSTSFGTRNLLPAYMTMICIVVYILLVNIPEEKIGVQTITSIAVVALSLVIFFPTLSEYVSNRKIINENIENYYAEGELYYDAGATYPCSYIQFFEASIYEDGFRKIYDCQDRKIHIMGDEFEHKYCSGNRCRPIYTEDSGVRYFPLRDTLEDNGWVLTYDPVSDSTLISNQNREIHFDNNRLTFTEGDVMINGFEFLPASPRFSYFFDFNIYINEEGFNTIFNISLD